jgi:hypothetical protein
VLREGCSPGVVVEVRNERFQRVLTATVSTHIDWVLRLPAWVTRSRSYQGLWQGLS